MKIKLVGLDWGGEFISIPCPYRYGLVEIIVSVDSKGHPIHVVHFGSNLETQIVSSTICKDWYLNRQPWKKSKHWIVLSTMLVLMPFVARNWDPVMVKMRMEIVILNSLTKNLEAQALVPNLEAQVLMSLQGKQLARQELNVGVKFSGGVKYSRF